MYLYTDEIRDETQLMQQRHGYRHFYQTYQNYFKILLKDWNFLFLKNKKSLKYNLKVNLALIRIVKTCYYFNVWN